MQKFLFRILLLVAAISLIPLSSCKDDDDDDKDVVESWMKPYIGYWVNSDHTTGLQITQSGGSSMLFTKSFTHGNNGALYTYESLIKFDGDNFWVHNTMDESVHVKIDSATSSKLILKQLSSYSLSSYIFSRVTESEFEDFLEGSTSSGNGGSGTTTDPELQKLLGSWKGDVDGDPCTLTFSSNGKMHEVIDYVDCGDANYTFSNGELDFPNGASIEDLMGSSPYIVEFPSTNKMKLTKKNDRSSTATFTRI